MKKLLYLICAFTLINACRHKPIEGEPTCELSVSAEVLEHIGCGITSGTVLATAVNGKGIYRYSIDNGENFQTSDTFSNLEAGNYTLIAKDTAGCEATANFTVKSSSKIIITLSTTKTQCAADNGSISVTATGGDGGYTYQIDSSNFQTQNVFLELGVGVYKISVKDASGCIVSKNGIIQDNGNVDFTSSTTEADCGSDNGSITITATAGTLPFEYSINNGASFQSSNNFINLAIGDYSVLVRDASGCSQAKTVTVFQEPSTITFTTVIDNADCNTSNGQITVNASGGAGGYTYAIGSGAFSASNVFSNLASGTYKISVKDTDGCIKSENVTVGVIPPSFSGEVFPIINSKCNTSNCHGNSGTSTKPDLRTYEKIILVTSKIKSEIIAGTMPKNGSLTQAQKDLIICWIDGGAPNN